MAQFTVGSTLIRAGAERRGAAVDPPDRVTAVKVQIVDTDGQWGTTSGNVLKWGIQASRVDGTFANDGTDWDNPGGVFQSNVPFGSLGRSGQLPLLRITAADADGNPLPIAPSGVKLRLAMIVDADIRLGAAVGTNTDAA